jgi:hypothetical protein
VEDDTMSIDDHGASSGAYQESRAPEERARDEARRYADTAVLAMASAAGAEVRERPIWPGKTFTVRDVAPEAGIRFAVMLAGAARQKVHGYLKQARQDGLTWQQIGQALRLERVAEDRGISPAEAAFDYATHAEHARPFEELSFAWTCPSCQGFVRDYGPNAGHPVDAERGHAGEDCPRLAATVAAYEAEWDDRD